jgi:hypothetical protein
MGKSLAFLVVIFCTYAEAQIIPDLTSGDHFQPYLTEGQRQRLVIKSFREKTDGKVPQTSQELYPQYYKYVNTGELPSSIQSSPAAPANAFKDNSRRAFMEPAQNPNRFASPTTSALYNHQISIEERNKREAEADMRAYEDQQIRKDQLLEEANKEFGPEITYHLGLHNGPQVDPYIKAYHQLREILTGGSQIDFLRATWLVENAVDPTLSWNEFNGMLQSGIQVITQLLKQQKHSPQDNLAKLMAIYQFMSDTTKLFIAAREKNVVTKPLLYDYDDYEAKKDITKVFVSKLLRTGSGQCMSMPLLYYLYAKAMGAQASLAFAPEHTYITFKDNHGTWQNIELTAGMFTTSDFYWQSGFIKSEHVKSGIYLRPLTESETVAYLLTTLTLAYVKTFGTDDRVLEMALTARDHFPNSLTANMIYAGYNLELWKHIQRQYGLFNLDEAQLNNDGRAQAVKQNKDAAVNHIYQDLGWTKMPDWAYKNWLDGVSQLASKRQHLVRKRQLERQLNK